jgi:hypothetical protein
MQQPCHRRKLLIHRKKRTMAAVGRVIVAFATRRFRNESSLREVAGEAGEQMPIHKSFEGRIAIFRRIASNPRQNVRTKSMVAPR